MEMAALAWAKGLFGVGGKQSNKSAQDHSRFNYSPNLIGELKDDHAGLLKMYGDIEAMAVAGRFATIPPALVTFKAKFDVHVLNENLHFYCYIEEKAAPEHQEAIKSFRAEMNAIARGVVNFVKKYHMAGVRPTTGNEFLTELRQVGALLVRRVEREEQELYTLYQP